MASLERSKAAINSFRRIVSELKKAKGSLSRDSPEFRFIMDQMRNHRVTQKMNCKSPNEMEHLADTYATYLNSTRFLAELQERYRGGERSVSESANLVGLQLPKEACESETMEKFKATYSKPKDT
uniref:Protein FMC1 homolog n=1 Tax=Panagrolaimus superbus TaxID=310955 RepID=A0A914YAN7_9BILA